LLFSLVAARGQKPDTSAADQAAFQRVCGACHTTAMIDSNRSMPDWRQTVDNMIEIGARGTPEDMERVMRFLARNWTRIDLNAATAEQFAAVLGIKEDLAKAVVKYRTDHGHFTAIGELKKVPGFEKINPEEYKDKLVVSGQGEEKR
jgi:competence ComEA-like helix-hairpin-helix protein